MTAVAVADISAGTCVGSWAGAAVGGGGAARLGRSSTASRTAGDSAVAAVIGSGSVTADKRMAVGGGGRLVRSCVVTTIRHVSSSI
jgi:hypothetical protein